MSIQSDNVYPKIILDGVTSDPAAPSNDNWKVYAKPDGVYARSSNSIVGPFGSGGGSVATDAIWDAKGDLAVGTGANTASKLTLGTDGHVLTADSAQATGVKWAAGGGGGITHAYLGYNTAGGSTEGMVQYRSYFKKITPGSSGLLVSVGAHIANAASNVESFAVAVLTDATNAPGNVIAMNMVGSSAGNALFASTTARWVDIPITAYLTGSTSYWVGISVQNTGTRYNLYYDGSGSDQYHTAGGFYIADGAKYALTVSSNQYSIRAGFLT